MFVFSEERECLKLVLKKTPNQHRNPTNSKPNVLLVISNLFVISLIEVEYGGKKLIIITYCRSLTSISF